MSQPATQDPAAAFDYASLTTFHDPAYDTLYGVALSSGWFLALAAGIIITVVRRVDQSKLRSGWARLAYWSAAILLAGPALASAALTWSGGTGVPNFPGLVQGATTSDRNSEFIAWADARYGVPLTEVQAIELQKLTNKGFMVTSNETNPVIFNGDLIHGVSAAGQIVLHDKDDKEVPVRR